MMEVPAYVLEQLKCSRCEEYLSRSPVYLQRDEAAVCGQCYAPERPAIRNKQYETTAKLLSFPCKFKEFGCPEKVVFVDEELDLDHEAVCEYRQYVCPVLGGAGCDWHGRKAAMLRHCRAQHPDRVFDNFCSLTHDVSKTSQENYLIIAFKLPFLLHTKVCVSTGKMFHSVRLLGTSNIIGDFCYHLNIKRNGQELDKYGKVDAQGWLRIEEDKSIAVDSSSLLSALGGLDNITFTVTVNKHWGRVEICAVCNEMLGRIRYRNQKRLQCERCVPDKRACKNQDKGCTFTDIPDKCDKHERYFCLHATKCPICKTCVSPGTLVAHYTSAHSVAPSGLETSTGWHQCVVPSVAGCVLCEYWITDFEIDLYVTTPLRAEQLSEFICQLGYRDLETNEIKWIYLGDIKYHFEYDWRLREDETHINMQEVNVYVSICENNTKNCTVVAINHFRMLRETERFD